MPPMTPEEIAAIADAIAEKLKPAAADLDWAEIDLPKASQPRPQSSILNDRLMAQLLAVAILRYDNSMGQVLRTAVEKYIKDVWPKYVDDLNALGSRYSMTPEQVFEALVKGEIKL